MYPHNQEAPFDVPENDPGSEWPEHGVVKFENYQVGVESVLRKNVFTLLLCENFWELGSFCPHDSWTATSPPRYKT